MFFYARSLKICPTFLRWVLLVYFFFFFFLLLWHLSVARHPALEVLGKARQIQAFVDAVGLCKTGFSERFLLSNKCCKIDLCAYVCLNIIVYRNE